MIEYLKHSVHQEPKLIIRTLIQKIIVFDDRIEVFYNYTEKNNPDDDNRDCFLSNCSDSYGMVEIVGVEPATS